MCGIVGYVGSRPCAPILFDGLVRLEYRGYDSAGLAVIEGGQLRVPRAVGKLSNLRRLLDAEPLVGATGIGHTRWATHGRPSEQNAHPHVAGPIAVVHNGIIENHLALRRELVAQGVTFSSETDTEIVAHLVHAAVKKGTDLATALRQALARVEGAYAVAVVSRDEPDRLVVAKNASPLVLGRAEGEAFAASDIPALLSHTREMLFLEDGEMAVLRAGAIDITRIASGEKVERKPRRIDWSPMQAEKGGYKHFMLKEIHEQPRAIEDTLRGRIDREGADVVEDEIGLSAAVAAGVQRVLLLACGTSHHATIVGRYLVERLAGVPAVTELASEFRYREPVVKPGDLVVAVSQSGETADTLAALKEAKARGAHVLALVNVIDSAIARTADGRLYTHAGPEIGVASTKCFTAQLAALTLLAVYIGRRRGTLDAARASKILAALLEIPSRMRETLAVDKDTQALAKKFLDARDFLYLGRGLSFAVALEGALKLKEISYVHAEGYAAGEMKHGPIALIDNHMPVVVVMPRDSTYEKILSNLQEAKAREGRIIAIATHGDEEVRHLAGDVIEVPAVEEELTPFATIVPLQLLAYHVADMKGTDVDQPRNLAKTVTVE
ncbi:MAG: glutamine--fructose-6-phosphate transaminase (isomerizing) [Deltaproteobacteria bacterium]|nr:glutamine--fructose-6-phosphate transaminase (isomerizing) [Deltaproteobacteria bacterium]